MLETLPSEIAVTGFFRAMPEHHIIYRNKPAIVMLLMTEYRLQKPYLDVRTLSLECQ